MNKKKLIIIIISLIAGAIIVPLLIFFALPKAAAELTIKIKRKGYTITVDGKDVAAGMDMYQYMDAESFSVRLFPGKHTVVIQGAYGDKDTRVINLDVGEKKVLDLDKELEGGAEQDNGDI